MSDSPNAPGQLEKILLFVNTGPTEDGEDEFSSPKDLARWLRNHKLLPRVSSPPNMAGLRLARELREAIYGWLRANNGGQLADRDVRVVNAIAERADLSIRLHPPDRARLAPKVGGIAGALGRIVAIMAAAMSEGTWPRMKACSNEVCHWAFFDRARNHTRRWCDMTVCGNRAKVTTYRRRRAAAK